MGQFVLNVPFESSPTDPASYAGARVLRMILLSLGLATPLPVDQMYTYAASLNNPSEPMPFWDIDPGAMHDALTNFDPRGPGHWVVYEHPGQPAADDQLQFTLNLYQVAAAALVYAGQHWVCVVGYTYDTNNNLTGIIYNDPAYTGGGANIAVSLTGSPGWDSAYTPVGGGTRWLNQIVDVGDPRPVENPLGRALRRPLRTGETIINPEEAAELAIEGALAQFGDLPNLRIAIENGTRGRPQLVAQLDRQGGYYYLIPLDAGDGERRDVLGAIMVDARFGDVLGASAAERPYSLWPVRHEDVRELVTRQPIPIYDQAATAADRLLDTILAPGAGVLGTEAQPARTSLRETVTAALGSFAIPRAYVTLRPNEFEIDPIWVWGPCGSISPFHPHYVVRTPWQIFYVNAFNGTIRSSFDFCFWNRLGA